jgi:methylenetetrahydrofolate dehydrogenase (NADP+)/methenyltetrahydrofolate cyclohydrolase
VVSAVGNPHFLTEQHIRPHHRLVVDSGFLPQDDGSIAGDIAPSARQVPQYITPVPGGIGPVEMAVLMERMVRLDVDPAREPWTVPQVPYLQRGEFAALASLAPASEAHVTSTDVAARDDVGLEHRTGPGRNGKNRSGDRGSR